MTANNRPRKEIRAREATVFLGLVQVGERSIRSRLVQPFGHAFENLGPRLGRSDGSGLEFPVGLGVQVARVERELVRL